MKPKNKKILALLCLPVLVMTMILPLCSFTTTMANPNYVWEPLVTTDVNYVYENISSTSGALTTYYGSISNYNRLLGPDFVEPPNRNNVEFSGSGYNILGSPSMKINYGTFSSGNSSITNDGLLTLQIQCSGGNDQKKLYFDNSFNFNGIINVFTTNDTLIIINPSDTSTDDFRCYGTADFCSVVDDELQYYTIDFLYDLERPEYEIQLKTIVSNIFTDIHSVYSGPVSDGFVYINNITLKILNLDLGATYRPLETSTVTIQDYVYNTASKWAIISDYLRETWFQDAYDIGFNAGMSQASTVWESLGDFLTTSVGAFFNFEFWDGFNLGTVMSIFVGAMLLVAFLRLFSGG